MEETKQPKWREINTNVWKPAEKGDNITGQLVRKVAHEEYSTKYYLELDDKQTVFLWGSAILDDRMALVKVGQFVRVTFEGKDHNKAGMPLNMYKVEVADELPQAV